MLTIKQMRSISGMTRKEFSAEYGIPLPTLSLWERGRTRPGDYVFELLEFKVRYNNACLEENSRLKKYKFEIVSEKGRNKTDTIISRNVKFACEDIEKKYPDTEYRLLTITE